MNAGMLYARVVGSAAPLQSVGGVAELVLNIDEEVKKQGDFSRAGGGTRATVRRIKSVNMTAKLQDLNPINLARVCFGLTSEIAAGTVTGESVVGFKGGLIRLKHIKPTSVVLKNGTTTIDAAGNYEVRPEGLFVFDNSAAITDALELKVDYAHSGYDLIEALTTAAPILEMSYSGLNEAMEGAESVVDIFRVQFGATKKMGLLDSDFAELDVEGEVMLDPTKTGEGVSRFFRKQMV